MEKNIYIPGDMVRYVGTTFKETAVMIDSLYGNTYALGIGTHLNVVNESEIAPISLTPEILEKNGWEFVERRRDEDGFEWHVYSKNDVLPDLYYYPTDGKDFSAFVCGSEVYPNIKYVHQLQHFLFGLGIKSEMEV